MTRTTKQNDSSAILERSTATSANDVHSDSFESKIDPYFTDKTKEKDHLTRGGSIKLQGKWT